MSTARVMRSSSHSNSSSNGASTSLSPSPSRRRGRKPAGPVPTIQAGPNLVAATQHAPASPGVVTLRAFLLSLLGIPAMWGLHLQATAVEDQGKLFATGVVTLLAVLGLLVVVIGPSVKQELYIALFALFAFTSVVDLVLAGTIFGTIDWMNFYLAHGEKYFKGAYGFAINLWDSTVHHWMYMGMIYGLVGSAPWKYRPLYLAWVGSIAGSLLVMIPGMAVGSHSEDLCLSTLLNIPYILVPLLFFKKLYGGSLARPASAPPAPRVTGLYTVPQILFLGYFVLATLVTVLRFMVALNSQAVVAKQWRAFEPRNTADFFVVAGSMGMYLLVPLFSAFIWALIFGVGAQTAAVLSDLAWVYAGLAAQSQFTFGVSSFLALHDDAATLPSHVPEFVVVNALLFAVPTVYAWYTSTCGVRAPLAT